MLYRPIFSFKDSGTRIHFGSCREKLDSHKLAMSLAPYFSEDVRVLRDDFGKPYIQNNKELFPISVANSNNITTVVFSQSGQCSLGIDFEMNTFQRFRGMLLKKILSQTEAELLSTIPKVESDTFLRRVFSLKEAILKDHGLGFFSDPKGICTSNILPALVKNKRTTIIFENKTRHLWQRNTPSLTLSLSLSLR